VSTVKVPALFSGLWVHGISHGKASDLAHNAKTSIFWSPQQEAFMSHFSAFTSTRRVFMMQVATAATAVLAVSEASAQAMLDEKDPQAVGLAYKADATKIDKAKTPKFVAGSNCANCALFQAKAGAAAGACPLFGAKQVAAKGWCSAWAKKA
jgi:hypothetical protein